MTKKAKVPVKFEGVTLVSAGWFVERSASTIKIGHRDEMGSLHLPAKSWPEVRSLVDQTNARYEKLRQQDLE